MFSHFAGTHAPAFKTVFPVHERHFPLLDPWHVPHEVSHFEQIPLAESRYSLEAQARTQVPLDVKTGLEGGQDVHLLDDSEQVAQSG